MAFEGLGWWCGFHVVRDRRGGRGRRRGDARTEAVGRGPPGDCRRWRAQPRARAAAPGFPRNPPRRRPGRFPALRRGRRQTSFQQPLSTKPAPRLGGQARSAAGSLGIRGPAAPVFAAAPPRLSSLVQTPAWQEPMLQGLPSGSRATPHSPVAGSQGLLSHSPGGRHATCAHMSEVLGWMGGGLAFRGGGWMLIRYCHSGASRRGAGGIVPGVMWPLAAGRVGAGAARRADPCQSARPRYWPGATGAPLSAHPCTRRPGRRRSCRACRPAGATGRTAPWRGRTRPAQSRIRLGAGS